jgi:hypothetical protein
MKKRFPPPKPSKKALREATKMYEPEEVKGDEKSRDRARNAAARRPKA